MVTPLEISRQTLFPSLIFNNSVTYNEAITLHPIQMKHIIEFQQYERALTLRKDSIFREKELIKMDYLDFIKYSFRNYALSAQYNLPLLPYYFDFILQILQLACGEGAELQYNTDTLAFSINGFEITNSVFNDLRKIIIIQNDIDFDMNEFMNIDTLQALEKAKEFETKKSREKSDIEDYIDSLIIEMKVTEEFVSQLTIRKFWRYINRINKHDEYKACRSGQMSGMVTFKEPIQHWMTSIDITDKYENLKTDEEELRSKIE